MEGKGNKSLDSLLEDYKRDLNAEIKRRLEIEDILKQNQERYQIITSLTSDYVFETRVFPDNRREIHWVAGSFKKITGYSFQEYSKITGWPKILHPEDHDKDTEAFQKLLKNQRVNTEVRLVHKNGKDVHVQTSCIPVWDKQNNRLKAIIGAVKDISEEKRSHLFREIQFNIAHRMITSHTLQELFITVKDELNKVIDAKNIFIALYDPKADKLTTILGADEKKYVKEIPPHHSLSAIVMKKRKTMLFKKKEILKLARKGEITLIGARSESWMGAPLIIKNRPLGIMAVQSYSDPNAYDDKAKEIFSTIASQLSLYIEQKKTEEFDRKLSKAVEQNPASIVITDTDGNIEYINSKFTEVTGYTLEEAIGQNPRILKSGEHDLAFYKNLWNTILSGKEWNGEFLNKRKNGELYWENALISPIFNNTGEITHLLGIKEDITEKKKLWEELIKAKEKAEESDRLKTAFLQNISHEIRTPLNGILGFAELLAMEDYPAQQIKTYASYILKSGRRLLNLINNIIDISRIESGSIPLKIVPFSLNQLLNELRQPFELQAQKKNLSIQFRFSLPDGEDTIQTDPERLTQIINNLLGNALKFTEKGSIELGYQKQEHEFLFWVKDTGRGIFPQHQKLIFERFYQADTSISRDFEGAGLGLPISKNLTELLGGRMWLKSVPGKGSTFYFTLPLSTTKMQKAPSSGENQKPVRLIKQKKKPVILIAEDDETGFLYLKAILSPQNVEIIRTISGKEAVALTKKHPEIDLVLMDIKLTELNGLEATRQIKAFRPTLPVIAQTAHAFASDKEAALKAGCDDFITKPIAQKKLIQILNHYIGKNPDAES
ncbi:PAS domain S-box protein [Candidatus Sulfidibacterium hydrothermale]|uniref:PAS domain S-box protein n=1 Tax=Candidatus Sulfidibacterium hydrothermale TaxID=2875962 RepID=UPI001F0A1423|nr:PAS domain S-box protein [Candidatus Sulfidibacterium hydrothermale]UBM61120.1 PAS domain S-box protein [Candidatus Sulfidibacterium hydrothermale]